MSEQVNDSVNRFQCVLRERPARVLPQGMNPFRLQLINLHDNKWTSGTTLHYYFFDRETDGENVLFTDGSTQWRTWVGADDQKNVVRHAFDEWAKLNVGVKFQEVAERDEAEIRIGFMRGDGSWSWLGREILDFGPDERTMNFGWDLTPPGQPEDIDTAIHEIGHTLGFPHEHQNPKAGIVWDEETVYAAMAEPPNEWDRNKTFWNIIRKLPPNDVEGTTWDPDSVMHYPFRAGLIKEPVKYADGLRPAGGLSPKDKAWTKFLYPPVDDSTNEDLKPSQSVLLQISAGEQRHLTVMPQETRQYNFQTFGTSDSVMVLFEDNNGELRYMTADDDSGQDTNAHISIRLTKGHKYVLRIRLYYSERSGQTSVMMW